MSKLGKKPINLPKDTKVKVEGSKLTLTGPKGSKELNINDKIFTTSVTDNSNLVLKLIKKNEEMNIIWGTTRSILNNAIIGVSVGHEKILELSGVGFRALLKGNILNLQLGFSHDTSYKIPPNSQDMLSALFYARTLNKEYVQKNGIFVIPVFIDEENYFLEVEYMHNEDLETKWGIINCMVFKPIMQEGRVFEDVDKMQIWITNDPNHLLVKVETKIWAGLLKAHLFNYKNLKYPLSISK